MDYGGKDWAVSWRPVKPVFTQKALKHAGRATAETWTSGYLLLKRVHVSGIVATPREYVKKCRT